MNKDYYRINIVKYERDCIESFYKQLIFKQSKQRVVNQAKINLMAIAHRLGLLPTESNYIWEHIYWYYQTLLHGVAMKKKPEDRAIKLTELIANLKRIDVYNLLNTIESRKKQDQMDTIMNSKTPFFLCSSHTNAATDHVDWQGMIYIRQNWRDYVDNDARKKVQAYIRNHQIRTVEWLIGAPVYMTTRPNCRHILIPIPIKDILGSSRKKILSQYNEPGKASYLKIDVPTYHKRSELHLLQSMDKIYSHGALQEKIKKIKKALN